MFCGYQIRTIFPLIAFDRERISINADGRIVQRKKSLMVVAKQISSCEFVINKEISFDKKGYQCCCSSSGMVLNRGRYSP